MASVVKAVGVPGDPLWLTAPEESGDRTLTVNRAEAEVFTTRVDALNGIAWLRRGSLPAKLRAAVLYVVDADRPEA